MTIKQQGLLLLFLWLLFSLPALASNKVSSPEVTRGQIELEYRGGYDRDDDRSSLDRKEVDKFAANYGLTDRWRMETKAIASGDGGDVDWSSLEYSNRYQLLKDKEGWIKLALQANYKLSLIDRRANKIEFTLLTAKDTGSFTHITNINAENEIGSYARGGTAINLGWKTKYRFIPAFEPGGELYADFGKMSGDNIKKYQIGPAISGKFSSGFKYDLGYLFGLNHDVPDGRAKLILTYAFKP